MPSSSMPLGRVLGIEIRIDLSWLLIAFLVGWSFYLQYALNFPDMETVPNAVLATASVIVFFGSVLVHELSHSVVARRLGVPVAGITLFIFGGVTRTKMEAHRPRDEFLIAVVGPVTSLVLAGLMWLLASLAGTFFADPIPYALGYLGWLNLILGVFNLLPGFPLDGGRVLRSILWRTSGSLTIATRRAAMTGRVIAMVIVGVGIFYVVQGNLGGLWFAAIGWFLYQAATVADQDVMVRALLREVMARDLMSPNLVTIPANATITEAVDGFFLRYDYSAFPVVDTEPPGLLTLRAIRQIPRDQWDIRQIWTATTSLEEACTVEPETPMDQVLERLREQEQDRVLVVDDSRIMGIITPRDIARWVRRSEELGLAETRPGLQGRR